MEIVKDVYLVGSGQIRISNYIDCHIYLIDGGNEIALIDAGVGLDTELIFDNIHKEGFNGKDIHYLLLTHTHADHAGGCKKIKESTGCKIITSEGEGRLLEEGSDEELGLDVAKRSGIYPQDYVFSHCKVDQIVKDNDAINVGRYSIKAILVPGHSKESVCYLLDQNGYKILFSSDVVFFGGTIGLGNWPGSSLEEYRKSIGKLRNLSIDALLPGHYMWTLKDGQVHVNKAIENLKLAWVPPAWQHQHPHY